MGYQKDRDDFFAVLQRELHAHPWYAVQQFGRALCRAATTMERLNVAQCNGDWPADNGERKTAACDHCERHWAPSTLTPCKALAIPYAATHPDTYRMMRFCQDCRVEERVRQLCAVYNVVAVCNGDPRGYALALKFPGSDRHNTWGGPERGYGVPTRGR